MKLFRNRIDAGRQLGEALAPRKYERPLVLGIPRGGVPVAAEVARILGGELGIVVARKLRAPSQPELAIGAVTTDGVTWINTELVREIGATAAYVSEEVAFQVGEAKRRQDSFGRGETPRLANRVVIIVDDGVATGATALAAARSARAAGARPLIVAVPVGPPETLDRLRDEADEVVCLDTESAFLAVGQFYADFRTVHDSDVLEILDKARAPVGSA